MLSLCPGVISFCPGVILAHTGAAFVLVMCVGTLTYTHTLCVQLAVAAMECLIGCLRRVFPQGVPAVCIVFICTDALMQLTCHCGHIVMCVARHAVAWHGSCSPKVGLIREEEEWHHAMHIIYQHNQVLLRSHATPCCFSSAQPTSR